MYAIVRRHCVHVNPRTRSQQPADEPNLEADTPGYGQRRWYQDPLELVGISPPQSFMHFEPVMANVNGDHTDQLVRILGIDFHVRRPFPVSGSAVCVQQPRIVPRTAPVIQFATSGVWIPSLPVAGWGFSERMQKFYEGTVGPSPWALAAGFGPYPRASGAGCRLPPPLARCGRSFPRTHTRFILPRETAVAWRWRPVSRIPRLAPYAHRRIPPPGGSVVPFTCRCPRGIPAEFAALAPAIEIVPLHNRRLRP